MDISYTNSALFMTIAVVLIVGFQLMGIRRMTLVPSRFQSMVELAYEFVANILKENAGLQGMTYFPLVFSVFMFVLMGNLLGLVPYAFTYTSHIVVTFGLAMIIFVTVTVIGILRHRMKFLRLFFPEGLPWAIAPILIPVEIISYFARPITLSVRLFANMLAGHVILKVFAGFTVMMLPATVFGYWAGWFGVVPLIVNTLFTAFEIFIALIQAYVFTILTCLYIHDALELH